MNIKLIPIKKDIKEKDFNTTIRNYGYRSIRFIKKNEMRILKIIKTFYKTPYFFNPIFKYRQIGKPDFFIWNKKEYFFCEFKSKTDMLSAHQMDWFCVHRNLPSALAYVSLTDEIFCDFDDVELYPNIIFTEEEDIKRIYKSSIYRLVVNEYCEKNQPLTMHKHMDSWVGMLPDELISKLKEKGVY